MLIVGLLSTKDEVQQVRYIANICILENRIHFLVKMQKIKDKIKEQRELNKV